MLQRIYKPSNLPALFLGKERPMKSNLFAQFIRTSLFCAILCLSLTAAFAQTTAFSYQGRFDDTTVSQPTNGSYDFQFALYGALSGGTQIGATQTLTVVNVSDGIFKVQLDFGSSPFSAGANRFLEISVKKPLDASYTTLTPRQQLTSSPYSIRTLSAASADTATTATNATNATNAVNAQTALTANTATTAGNVTGIVQIANGGTGSSTKNFVDLSTNQTNIGGDKTFTGTVTAQNTGVNTDVITATNTAPAGTGSGAGIIGTTNQAGAGSAGVWGQNNNTNGTGVIAGGNGQTASTLSAGSGLAATGFTTAIYARSNNPGISQAIYTDNFGSVTRVNYWSGTTQYKINGTGAVSTLVNDGANQKRVMFAPEAPEVLLEDYGTGTLAGGRARIELDPIFARNIAVSEKRPLKVFIQLEGDCNGVYVTNKTASGFDVVELLNGKSNVRFSWHAVGNRADEDLGGIKQLDGTFSPTRISRYSDLRFPVQEPETPTSNAARDTKLKKTQDK